MSYERDLYMRRQEQGHDLIRMRDASASIYNRQRAVRERCEANQPVPSRADAVLAGLRKLPTTDALEVIYRFAVNDLSFSYGCDDIGRGIDRVRSDLEGE